MANVVVTTPQDTVNVNVESQIVTVASSTIDVTVGETTTVTNSIIRGALSAVDAGGDGSFSYDAVNGVFTYTGPSAAEVRAHFSNTSPILYNASTGVISIDSDAVFSGKTTDDLAQGNTNIYFSTSGAAVNTDNLPEGSTNKYYSSTLFNADFATKTTDDLTEGTTNLYFANSLARAAISVSNVGGDGNLSYSSNTGVISYQGPTQADWNTHAQSGLIGGDGIDFAVDNTISVDLDPVSYLKFSAGKLLANASTLPSAGKLVVYDADGDLNGDDVDASNNVNAQRYNISSSNVSIFQGSAPYAVSAGNTATIFNIADSGDYGNMRFVINAAKKFEIVDQFPGSGRQWLQLRSASTSPWEPNLVIGGGATGSTVSAGNFRTTSVDSFFTHDSAKFRNANLIADPGQVTNIYGPLTVTSSGGSSNVVIGGAKIDINANNYDLGLSVSTGKQVSITGNTAIAGNLTVSGNLNYENVTDLYVTDQKITLNANAATDADVFIYANRPVAGANSFLKWNESSDQWEFSNDGSNVFALSTAAGISAVVDDTSPQLGGNLDTNGFNINFGTGEYAYFGDSNEMLVSYDTGHANVQTSTGNLNLKGGNIEFRDTSANLISTLDSYAVVAEEFLHTKRTTSSADSAFIGYQFYKAITWFGSAGSGGGQDYVQLQVAQNASLPSGTAITISGIPSASSANTFNSKTYYVGTDTVEAYPLYEDAGLTTPLVSGLGDYSGSFGVYVENTTNANEGNLFVTNNITANNITADIITATTEFLGDLDGAISVGVYNDTASTLTKGQAVYVTGAKGNEANVAPANNQIAAQMPAMGIVKENIGAGQSGQAVTNGTMNFAGHGFSVGADLYVNGAGLLTETIPTGEGELLQKIAKALAPNFILVQGAGRTNATPNLDEGNIFLGNASNTPVTATLDTSIVPEAANTRFRYYDDAKVEAYLADVNVDYVAGNTRTSASITAMYGSAGYGAGQDYIQLAVGANLSLASGTEITITGIPVGDQFYMLNNKTFYVGAEATEAYPLYYDAGLTLPSQTGLGNDLSPSGWNINYVGSTPANITSSGSVIGAYLHGDGSNVTNIVESNLPLTALTDRVATSDDIYAGFNKLTGTAIYGSAGWGAGTDYIQLSVAANVSLPNGTRVIIRDHPNSTFENALGGRVFYTGTEATEAYPLYEDSGLTTPSVSGLGNDLSNSYSLYAQTSGNGDVVALYLHGDGSNISGITGGGGNAFGIVSVSGQSNVTADASTDQITFVAGSGMTLTTNATTSEVTFTSTGGYGNTDVQTWLDSGLNTGNIITIGNLDINGTVANANLAVAATIGYNNAGTTTDLWQFSGGQVFSDGTAVTGNSFTGSPWTSYNGNTYYLKWNGPQNAFEIWGDAGFTSAITIGGGGFDGSSTGQAEYVSTNPIQANIAGTLEVTSYATIASDGSNADFGGNITTGSGSGLWVGSRGVNAVGGGTITMNSLRVTDFKANDPLGIQVYANSALSGLAAPFTGSIIYVTGDRNGAEGAPAYYSGTAWKYFSDDANVTI